MTSQSGPGDVRRGLHCQTHFLFAHQYEEEEKEEEEEEEEIILRVAD